mmetsp:Transcript_20597/g.34657  ORF Transcript_20597/g.34657 Transcript_20597/m.34657 type:complete len:101 (-) Transcript_20597:761-1063(-)
MDDLLEDEDTTTDPFYENLENSNGRVIVFIARGVGILVAFAALMFLVLILVFLRASLAMFIFKWGALATICITFVVIQCSLKYGRIPMKNFVNLLLRACH